MRSGKYCGVLLVSFRRGLEASFAFPILGRSLLFSTGYPPPPFDCKIFKTNELFCDYVLDL